MRKPTNLEDKKIRQLPDVDPKALEKLAGKADSISAGSIDKGLDPEASRNYKTTTMPFNEYEHTVLLQAAEKANYKSVKQFMRDAYLEKSLHILQGKPYDSI